MEKKIKHLEMIQGVINRMASNSFILKGWAVTLVSGIFALAEKNADRAYFFVAYIPIIVFWGLDSYYLFQERLYRALYDKVRHVSENQIDFSMLTSAKEFESDKNCFTDCFWSVTELWFYLPLAIVATGIIFVTHCS